MTENKLVTCPYCQTQNRLPEGASLASHKVNCGSCHNSLNIVFRAETCAIGRCNRAAINTSSYCVAHQTVWSRLSARANNLSVWLKQRRKRPDLLPIPPPQLPTSRKESQAVVGSTPQTSVVVAEVMYIREVEVREAAIIAIRTIEK